MRAFVVGVLYQTACYLRSASLWCSAKGGAMACPDGVSIRVVRKECDPTRH